MESAQDVIKRQRREMRQSMLKEMIITKPFPVYTLQSSAQVINVYYFVCIYVKKGVHVCICMCVYV